MLHTKITFSPLKITAAVLLLALCLLVPTSASASLTIGEDGVSNILKLEAKIKYLKAWIEALEDGEPTPGPTMLVYNAGRITLIGTLAQDPNPTRLEICGPMKKGTVDWGDGVVESIIGLGCSGDAHEFVAQHDYAESGSYPIMVTDTQGRTLRHVVAVLVKDN